MILKPFMLRRIKRDVENELSEKVPYRSLYFLVISACMHYFSAGVFALKLLLCCMKPIDKKGFHTLTRRFFEVSLFIFSIISD